MKRLLSGVVCCVALGCGGVPVADFDGGDGSMLGMTGSGGGGGSTGGAGGSGGSGGSTGGAGGVGAVDLPCDVQAVVSTCTSCHGTPLAGGAPYRIATRADLMAAAPGFAGSTVADRSLVRMASTTAPMPPSGVNAANHAVLNTWVQGGLQAGSCSVDAGPAPTTCASNSRWTLGTNGSTQMLPGEACVACHKTRKPSRAYYFMGTVFPSEHEQDSCNARPPAGVVVDIIGSDGGVLTLTPRSPSGNFYSASLSAGTIGLPYTARVRDSMGRTRTMTTPQTNGDCNVCHTEQGAQGAPGRVTWPN